MLKHPCVKECPYRSTYCKLSCEKFKTYETEKKIEWELNEPKRQADMAYRAYKAERSNENFKRWCTKRKFIRG